jgi:TonB-dependent receptor
MNISTAFKCLIVFLIGFSINVFSQGTIKGVIKDAITGDRLVGTNVHLAGTSLGASTNIEGEYKIVLIPAGNYKVKISYIGYKPQEKEITISSGQTITWDAELKMDMVEGSEILVTGQAMGQASAINQQKNSNTIVNVLSEEKIQSLPDANAAEAIGRLPGVSIQRSGGEANKIVLRGMSDKFSFVTIDGIRMAPTDADSRGIDLSTISQGSLAGIELFKALTPDKDADAIAGSVNLVTRKAPDQRLLRVDAKGAYNDLKNTLSQYDFQLRYGERFFDNVLGVQLTGNLEKRDRSNEKYKLTYETKMNSLGTEPVHEIADFDLLHTSETRERQGLSLLLDINTPDDGSIRINNVFNGTSRDYATYERHYPTNGQQLSNAGGVPYSVREQQQTINTYNSSIRGNNNILDLNVVWGASFAQSLAKFPFDFEMDFSEPTNIVNGNYTSGFLPISDQSILTGSNPEKIIPYFINSFDQALSSYGYYRQERNLDKERTAFLDVSGKYAFGDMLTGEAKAGAKYRYKNRTKSSEELDSQDYLYPLSSYYSDLVATGQSVGSNGASVIRIPELAGTRFEYMTVNAGKATVTNFMNSTYQGRNIFDKYNLYPMIDPDAIKEWYRITQNGCALQYKKSGQDMYQKNWAAVADYYDILERTSAAYVMNTLNYGQLVTFIAGLRVEREQNNYQSIWIKDPVSGFSSNPNWAVILASHTETVYCPNFNLTMRPTDFMNVRFAAYKALARPDYNMRLNRYYYSVSGSNRTLDCGNPNLVAAQAWNYEANTSFFDNAFGLVTVSVFYKNISHMYHKLNSGNTAGDSLIRVLGANWNISGSDGYALTMPYNSDKPTKVWGFEFEHQARFDFLPGLLKNIVLSYNCSFVKSETYTYKTKTDSTAQYVSHNWHGQTIIDTVYKPYFTFFETKTKLEGQPEFFGNVSLGYDIAGFSIRLSYFYQSRYTTSYSLNGFNDSIQVAYGRMDLALKYEYDKHVSVFANINNLTDAEEKTIRRNRVDGWEVVTSSQRYGMTGDVGIRYTF